MSRISIPCLVFPSHHCWGAHLLLLKFFLLLSITFLKTLFFILLPDFVPTVHQSVNNVERALGNYTGFALKYEYFPNLTNCKKQNYLTEFHTIQCAEEYHNLVYQDGISATFSATYGTTLATLYASNSRKTRCQTKRISVFEQEVSEIK